jgi:hypothetical protein
MEELQAQAIAAENHYLWLLRSHQGQLGAKLLTVRVM